MLETARYVSAQLKVFVSAPIDSSDQNGSSERYSPLSPMNFASVFVIYHRFWMFQVLIVCLVGPGGVFTVADAVERG